MRGTCDVQLSYGQFLSDGRQAAGAALAEDEVARVAWLG